MLAIAACTYKRPDYLERLLTAFARLRIPRDTGSGEPEPVVFVIVDNDGNDPAVGDLVARLAGGLPGPIDYVIEREPGISAARNSAFATARRLGAQWLAMLDDDEWPPEQWLEALYAERDRSRASVVGGPVRPVFPDNRRDLDRHARFWSVESIMLQGKPFVFCTCNFLIELAVTDFLGDTPFDPAFGITGGGDTVFFRSLFARGVRMSWSEDAWISEEIPASRASVKWLRQRRYRAGNVAYRWEREHPLRGEWPPAVKNFILAARLPFYPLVSRERSDRMLAWMLEYDRVRGRLAAQFGSHYAEYSRPGTASPKACR